MRVLLIESEPEDVLFLRDVLTEIGEGRYWSDWVQIETLHAASWTDAASILAREPVDVMLLDVDLPDSQGMETFRRAQNAAAGVPVVLLLSEAENALGARLIRDGAQDFLMKKHVDCAPLAHAMRNAIDRHRLLMAARAAATHDTLTGLLNRAGFYASADRDRKLAERLDRRWMLLVAEPRNLADLTAAQGEQRRDLALVEAADHLRSLAGPADLLARIDTTRFGMTIFDTEQESAEEAWARIHSALLQHRIVVGSAIFSQDHPATLDALVAQAVMDLEPARKAASVRT
jgi:PleD family two-component response regulator